MKDVIVCKSLEKTFQTARGPVEVIGDVSLRVQENEFLVLFGPGQCGKSTVINCLSGLEPVTGGLTPRGNAAQGEFGTPSLFDDPVAGSCGGQIPCPE